MPRTIDHVMRLIVYVYTAPHGRTVDEIAAELGLSHGRTTGLIKTTRQVFKDRPENLVCEPPGVRGPWLYHFVGTFDESRFWREFQTGRTRTSFETLCDVTRSYTLAHDDTTVPGRTARRLLRQLDYLRAELEDLITTGATAAPTP